MFEKKKKKLKEYNLQKQLIFFFIHRVEGGFLLHRLWSVMDVLMCEGGGGRHILGL